MKRAARAWRHFWFRPAPATDLAVSRMVFFGALAVFYAPQHFAVWSDVTPALWQPIWLFDRFAIPVLPTGIIASIEIVWKLSLVTSAIGLLTPVSIATSAVLGTYLLGLPHNFGQTYHFDAVLVLAFWILAFSRCGDAFSLDAARRAAAGARRPPPSGEYRWPVQLVLVALSFVFFAAGFAKLSRTGLEWITSDHLGLLLHRVQYHISDADPLVDWGVAIAQLPGAASLLAFTTVFVETAYPSALFSRRLRLPMVLSGIALIVGIRLLMGPTFEHFLAINAFWVPWGRGLRWLRQREGARHPLVQGFDVPVATDLAPSTVYSPHLTPPDVSVVVPTWNRAAQLRPLLERLLEQRCSGFEWDVLIVDNNSRDSTREVVAAAIRRDASGRLRYAFEPRQGPSYARNTGIELTTAPIVLFLDDDGLPGLDWLQSFKDAFDTHLEADCIGGRVKPRWSAPPPDWFTNRQHAGPLALQDRPHAAYVNAGQASACLLTANLGIRRSVFEIVGGFSPDYPRGQDRELELRMWRAGLQGLYLPAMEVVVEVPPERLTRRYHRQWHATTARYHALMRYRDAVDADGVLREESPDARRLLGIPLFMYRAFLAHAVGWLRASVRRRSSEAFFHETRLWYYAGFFFTRLRHPKGRCGRGPALRMPPPTPIVPRVHTTATATASAPLVPQSRAT
jgi:glycosyltransferase involved in cell wall biosynthesis